MPTEVTFAKLLRDLRTQHDLTLRPLAQELGCTFAYLSQLEAGMAKPSEELVRKLAKHFKLAPNKEEEMLFIARGVREQIEDIKKKFPHVAPAYFRKALKPEGDK